MYFIPDLRIDILYFHTLFKSILFLICKHISNIITDSLICSLHITVSITKMNEIHKIKWRPFQDK